MVDTQCQEYTTVVEFLRQTLECMKATADCIDLEALSVSPVMFKAMARFLQEALLVMAIREVHYV